MGEYERDLVEHVIEFDDAISSLVYSETHVVIHYD